MRMYDIIEKKRDGKILSKEEIGFFIDGYTNGLIKDYQASALLMAIYLKGMDDNEILDLTIAMVNSGDTIDLSQVNGRIVDKHSTGGVGDTVTLILGPMVAACGVSFAKMSGRGLGHTGGTIDKLEAIKGIQLELDDDEFKRNLNKINIAICGQTGNIAPADKKIYALRDVTATVDNLSLIASSIMSKKLAIKSDAILLDVKVGSGAFMKNIDDAIALGQEMVKIGKGYGRETVAVVTNMNEPLGYAIGNNLEVIEAIDTLKGHGPKDLLELCLELGIEILLLSDKFDDEDHARKELEKVILDGSAYKKFIEMIELQGGDSSYIKNINLLAKGKYSLEIKSKKDGYISSINAEEIGKASLVLGAGRKTMDSKIDLTAGILLNKKVDDRILEGEIICTLFTSDESKLLEAKEIVLNNIIISNEFTNKKQNLIYKKIR